MGRLTEHTLADGRCEDEPVISLDDAVDPPAGTLIAIFMSSH